MTTTTRVLGTLLAGALAVTACSSPGDGEGGGEAEGLALLTDGTTSTPLDATDSSDHNDAGRDASESILSIDADPDLDPPTDSSGGPTEGAAASAVDPSTGSSSATTGSAGASSATAEGGSGASDSTSSTGAGSTTTTTGATTTSAPTTPRPSSTTSAPSSTRPSSGGRFATLPVGATLPSGSECAGRVRSAPETRSGNASYNATRGNGSHDIYPRVDGNFTGTTDEIIQWAACKWGLDEDLVRAQAAIESWWDMNAGGDRTSDQSACHPALRGGSECPESIGLLQVRYLYHGEAFENENAIRSTAYNIDYTYAVMRECYEGGSGWLNTVERGREYGPGDIEGCLGVWFSGRWYTAEAVGYIGRVNDYLNRRIWETSEFLNY